jgi:predicted Ser/Thr protein kinase
MSAKETKTFDFAELAALTGLEQQTLEPIKVGAFLQELHRFPERALQAPGLLARAIDAEGEVDIHKQPAIVQPRLRMLRREGVKLYKAFTALRGQQRMVHHWVNHLRAAAYGGEAAKLATVFKGRSGTGKTMLVEIIKDLMNGQLVYHVEGCPVHENPLALLKLLPPDNRQKLLKRLQLDRPLPGGATFMDIIDAMGEPCRHCHGLVMGNADIKDPNQALFEVNVVPTRLSTYSFGVATLTKETIHSLLREASRGIADFGELFAGFENEHAAMAPHAKDLSKDLHDALNDQRIPGIGPAAAGDKDKPVSVVPVAKGWEAISVVPIAQVNPGAFDGFKKSLGPDGGKYMRLMKVVDVLHNASVSEEVLTYRDHMVNPEGVKFDPLALQMLAWIAQSSRYATNENKLEWTLRARLNDGENLLIKRSDSGSGKKHWDMKDLWEEFDNKDGVNGLNVPIMLLLLADIIANAVDEGHKCVCTYDMLKFVRRRFREYQKSDGFWEDEKQAAKSVADNFLNLVTKEEKPSGAEAIYRRELKKIATAACAPDYDRLLRSYFLRYWQHGAAASANSTSKKAFDRNLGKVVSIDRDFLEAIEKLAGQTSEEQRRNLRASVDEWVVNNGLKATQDPSVSPDAEPTLSDFPVLDRAIHAYLDEQIAKRVERLLNDETQLNEKERAERQTALAYLTNIGYNCERCRSAALQYIKDFKVWAFEDATALS